MLVALVVATMALGQARGQDPLAEKQVGKRYRIKVTSAGVPTLGGFLEGYSCRTTYRVLDKDGKALGSGFLNDYVYVDGPGDYTVEVNGRKVTDTFAVPDEMTPDRVQASWRRARAVELRPKSAGGRLAVPSIWALHPPHVVGDHNDDFAITALDEDGKDKAVSGVAVVYPPEEIHDIDAGGLFKNTLVHLWPGLYTLVINGTVHPFELKAGDTKLIRLGALVVHEQKGELRQSWREGLVTGSVVVAKPPIGKFFVVAPGTYEDGAEKVEVGPGTVGGLHAVKRPFADKPRLGVKATDAGKDEGAVVGGFVEGSPAATAGLKVGDRIVALDGKDVKGADDLVKLLESKKPGDEVTLSVRRAGRAEAVEVKVKLGG